MHTGSCQLPPAGPPAYPLVFAMDALCVLMAMTMCNPLVAARYTKPRVLQFIPTKSWPRTVRLITTTITSDHQRSGPTLPFGVAQRVERATCSAAWKMGTVVGVVGRVRS